MQPTQPRTSFGPGLVVAVAALAVLFGGPFVMRRLVHAKQQADVVQAVHALESGSILDDLNRASRRIAIAVEPSVVHVSTAGELRTTGRSRSFTASGSGWIYDEEGHVVTNAHVVEGAQRLEVQFSDGSIRPATVVGSDLRTDIAVVRVAPGEVIPARRSRELPSQGDLVFAFGSPFDFRFSMSSGIVSGVGRAAGLDDIDFENFIQVDAAINPGNSGGPLTDVRGRVIGMNTAIATGRGNMVGQGQFAGIGLAIPMTMIENVADQLIAGGEVEKGFIGVNMDLLARAVRYPAGSPVGEAARAFSGDGIVVTNVVDGGPADLAGILPGDVIVAIDDSRVSSIDQVRALIGSQRPGMTVRLQTWRLDSSGVGRNYEVDVTLARLDPNETSIAAQALQQVGLAELATSSVERAASLDAPYRRGIIVLRLDERRPIAQLVEPGATLVSINGQPVLSLDQLYARVERLGQQYARIGVPPEAEFEFVLPDGSVRAVRVKLPRL